MDGFLGPEGCVNSVRVWGAFTQSGGSGAFSSTDGRRVTFGATGPFGELTRGEARECST